MSKIQKITKVFLCVFVIFLFMFPFNVSAKTYYLTYSIFFPSSHLQYKTAERWKKEVEKKTGGRIKITMFPGGTLTKAKNCYDGVVKGISDIGMSCFAYTRGKFPVMEACDLPIGYSDGETVSRAVFEFYKKIRPKELDNVKVLYIHGHGPGFLHTIRPVNKLEDLNKMKIRATGLSAKVVSSLGAVPVAMPQGSTYEALKRGVVEGTFGPVEVLKGWRQAEVIKFTTDTSKIGYTTTMFVVMNKEKWNKLPDDIKKIMNEISEKWVLEHGRAWLESDKNGKKYSMSLGNNFITIPDSDIKKWKKRVSPVIKEYIKSADNKGLDGKKIVDTLSGLISRKAN